MASLRSLLPGLIVDETAFLEALDRHWRRAGADALEGPDPQGAFIRQGAWSPAVRRALKKLPEGFITNYTLRPAVAALYYRLLKGRAPKAVAEFGSGASSVLMALACAPGTQLFSLEHDALWARRSGAALKALGLERSLALVHAPLRWRSGPPGADRVHSVEALKRAKVKLDFVLIDAPPGSVGRGGVYPAVKPYLNAGCLLLLDDARRSEERRWVRRWTRDKALKLLGYVAKGHGAALMRYQPQGR
jgi:predicted O-methyltransferase YrrM